jgi:tetratricopeptide (TPR) repeat protein
MQALKRSDAEQILRKIIECKKHLQLGRIYSSLLEFSELLEKSSTIQMLSADEKHINQEINAFQRLLQNSQGFKDIFGPVTFQDGDKATTLSFIKQLIVVEEDEILAGYERQNNVTRQNIDFESSETLVRKIVLLIDRGAHDKARELYSDDETIRAMIVKQYNRSGIGYRKEGLHAEALVEFGKALIVEPEDEGLHYNIARVHIDMEQFTSAKESLRKAMEINPNFKEGKDLLIHVEKRIRIHPSG